MVRSLLGTLAALSVIVAVDRAGIGWGVLTFVSVLAGSALIDLANQRALGVRDDRQLSDRRAWRTGARSHGN